MTPGLIWFSILLGSVCFEGLGRKFIPQIPAPLFYFFKDGVLIVGLLYFGVAKDVIRIARSLYGNFIWALLFLAMWVVVQMLNPENGSVAVALIGGRAYLLWWVAPLLIATVLRRPEEIDRAVVVLGVFAIGISIFAAVQFALPSTHPLNVTAHFRGEVVRVTDVVVQTSRARVSSTFSFIAGFTSFVTVAIAVLMAFGLDLKKRWMRTLALAASAALAATVPASGSRAPIFLVGMIVIFIGWSAGFFRTRAGRRLLIFVAVIAVSGFFAMPNAVRGVRDRLEGSDTNDRVWESLIILPPVAISESRFPILGAGTGTQQNARISLGVRVPYNHEDEPGRILVELGIIGYLVAWTARLGLLVALWRARRKLRRWRQMAIAGAAGALAAMTMYGTMVFDHIWQALFFIAVGLVLAAVRREHLRATANAQPVPNETEPLYDPQQ